MFSDNRVSASRSVAQSCRLIDHRLLKEQTPLNPWKGQNQKLSFDNQEPQTAHEQQLTGRSHAV